MNQRQFEALLAYIDARIEEKILNAKHRGSLQEALRTAVCEQDLQSTITTDLEQ